MATLKVKWSVEACAFNDIEVRATDDDGDGKRVEIEQGEDSIWIAAEDVPELISALGLARAVLSGAA